MTANYAFLSFGIVLLVWELLPTFVTVWFFRVRQPDGVVVSFTSLTMNCVFQIDLDIFQENI